MPKIGEIIGAGGVLPALAAGKFGDENRGFALGLLPGLAYKDRQRKKQDGTPDTDAGTPPGMRKGGKTKKMAAGGSASKRADGCAQRGKTRGRII